MKKTLIIILLIALTIQSTSALINSTTVLYIPANGTSASTTFPDLSTSAHTITATGNANISTAIVKFGSGSAFFDGTGDYLTSPDSSDWTLSAPSTISFWMYPTGTRGDGVHVITGQSQDSTHYWELYANNGGSTTNIGFQANNGSGGQNFYASTSTDAFALNTWNYVVIVINGANSKIYTNGTSRPLEANTVTSNTPSDNTGNLTIGKNIGSYGNYSGYIDDFVFSKGVELSGIETTDEFLGLNATVFTTQDIWMEGEYLQTFVVTDITTDMPINNVTVTDSDGDTTTTASNGTAWLTESFGAYTVLFSASGYDAKTVAYVFDSNATHYVELSPSSTDTNYTGPDVTPYPKYVTFHIKEGFGNPVQDVNVSILAVSTSTGNWDWVLTLLGIPLDEVAVNGTEMYQTTDSMGTATFYVIPTAKYNITFSKAGYTISSMVLVPQDDDYIIWAEGTGATYYEHDYDEVAMVNITVKTVIINDTHAFINMTYNDTLAHTTGGFINVTQKNASPWGAPVTVVSWPAVSSSFTNSTIVTHTGQVSGSVSCNVSHSDFGQVERSSPWSLKGTAVKFLGFGEDIALLVALGIMMLTVMLAGAVHARHTVVAMAFEGWIFYAIDWFAALEARGISETAILLALTLLTILGFVAHFEVRKRKEKY